MGWENWDFPKGWVRVTMYTVGSGRAGYYPICATYLTWPANWPPRNRRPR